MMFAQIIRAFIVLWRESALFNATLTDALTGIFPLIHGRAQAGDVVGSPPTPYATIGVTLQDTEWYSQGCMRRYLVKIECFFGQYVADTAITEQIAALFNMSPYIQILDPDGSTAAIVISCRPMTGEEQQDTKEEQQPRVPLLTDVNKTFVNFLLTLGENP